MTSIDRAAAAVAAGEPPTDNRVSSTGSSGRGYVTFAGHAGCP